MTDQNSTWHQLPADGEWHQLPADGGQNVKTEYSLPTDWWNPNIELKLYRRVTWENGEVENWISIVTDSHADGFEPQNGQIPNHGPWFPANECGNNADWCVSAWHLGPGPVANMHDGDVYVLDTERDAGDDILEYIVVRRWYPDEGNDRIDDISEHATWRKAMAAARKLANTLTRTECATQN